MRNCKTEDSQHRARWWSGWEEEEEGKKERKEEIGTTRGSTSVESYFAKCYCLINSKMAAPLVRWSLARFRELDGEQWGATQKRKPTKSFNHRAASLLFLLAAVPCLCKETFFVPLLLFVLLSRLYRLAPQRLFLTGETSIALRNAFPFRRKFEERWMNYKIFFVKLYHERAKR